MHPCLSLNCACMHVHIHMQAAWSMDGRILLQNILEAVKCKRDTGQAVDTALSMEP